MQGNMWKTAEEGVGVGFETEKEKTEQAVENPRNSEIADVNVVEETL